jgi:hypothetical protein
MNTKKLTTICVAIITIAIIVCGIITVYNTHEIQKELNKPVIYNNTIEGVGTFQSTNCTNFTNIKDDGNGQIYYKSNLTGAEVSVCDKDKRFFDMDLLQAEKVNDSPKGHTIYKTHANVGECAGQVRYTAVINDDSNNRIILISSPDKNLTDLMVDTFKVLQPVKKQEVKNTDKVTDNTDAKQDTTSNNNPKTADGQRQMTDAELAVEKAYGRTANSPEEYEAQKRSLGY